MDRCGPRGLPWALLALGLVVGMAVFFEVGLVLLLPIVVEAARRTGRPPLLVGIPVMAGLSIMHGTGAAAPGGHAGRDLVPRGHGAHDSVGAGDRHSRQRAGRSGTGARC